MCIYICICTYLFTYGMWGVLLGKKNPRSKGRKKQPFPRKAGRIPVWRWTCAAKRSPNSILLKRLGFRELRGIRLGRPFEVWDVNPQR